MSIPENTIDQERLQDKTKLFLRVTYTTSVVSIIFGGICYAYLNITQIIPFILFGFGTLNLLNVLYFRKHKNIVPTFNFASILALIGSFAIAMFSGGIQSPFIFLMTLIAFGGYVNNGNYGKVFLYITFLLILLLYSQSIEVFKITKNAVPEDAKALFSLISILFAVSLLGNILGKSLLKTYNALYTSKKQMTLQINEKENLLKEVHHRVKNNLQTVSSLLNLQSRNIENGHMKGVLKGTQNRVIAMSMVHEMLYMRNDISNVAYKSYVQELGEYLIRSIKGADNKVTLTLNIPEIKLGIDTAIPLGLLINEILTNALKYGITGDEEGIIYVGFHKEVNDLYILEIGDNGKGFPDTITHKNTKSLGLKLIHNLTRQLRGTLEMDKSKKGTNYIIKFSEIKRELAPLDH